MSDKRNWLVLTTDHGGSCNGWHYSDVYTRQHVFVGMTYEKMCKMLLQKIADIPDVKIEGIFDIWESHSNKIAELSEELAQLKDSIQKARERKREQSKKQERQELYEELKKEFGDV